MGRVAQQRDPSEASESVRQKGLNDLNGSQVVPRGPQLSCDANLRRRLIGRVPHLSQLQSADVAGSKR